jgi:hypothetical protein
MEDEQLKILASYTESFSNGRIWLPDCENILQVIAE